MDKHVIWLWIIGAYPTLHVLLKIAVKYMPDPPEKGWYAVVYHLLDYFAIGNGAKP